jgi:hypothetical protein
MGVDDIFRKAAERNRRVSIEVESRLPHKPGKPIDWVEIEKVEKEQREEDFEKEEE